MIIPGVLPSRLMSDGLVLRLSVCGSGQENAPKVIMLKKPSSHWSGVAGALGLIVCMTGAIGGAVICIVLAETGSASDLNRVRGLRSSMLAQALRLIVADSMRTLSFFGGRDVMKRGPRSGWRGFLA